MAGADTNVTARGGLDTVDYKKKDIVPTTASLASVLCRFILSESHLSYLVPCQEN